DTSFVATGGIDGNGSVSALARQANGAILIGGQFTSVGGLARSNLVRLNPNGSIDPTFVPPTSLGALPVLQLLPLPDGKMIVVSRSLRLVRLNADGTLDESFIISALPGEAERAALAPNGKIIVAGSNSSSGYVVR